MTYVAYFTLHCELCMTTWNKKCICKLIAQCLKINTLLYIITVKKKVNLSKTFSNIVKSQMMTKTPYLLVRTQFSLDGNRNFVVLNGLWVKQLFQEPALMSLLLHQLWGEVRWVWDTTVEWHQLY